MKIKLGVAPIAWTNDDLPELGGDTPLETCLGEARQAGYTGVEIGGKFPRTAPELRAVLEKHDLVLCSGWYSGTLLDKGVAEEKDQILPQLMLFRDLDAPCIVYGETAGTVQNVRDAPLSTRRTLDEDQIRSYGRRLTELGEFCAEHGVPFAFHHHMATAIESERDTDLVMKHTGEAVGLLFDPGHMAFAGGDPLAVIDKHGHRIAHFHAKDVRRDVIDSFDRDRVSFLDAVLAGAFTVPDDGSLNFDTIAQRLADKGYEGWCVVEAEQDPAKANPLVYAGIGYDKMVRALTAAGYEIVGR